ELVCLLGFVFRDPAPTAISTLSLHDALPISRARLAPGRAAGAAPGAGVGTGACGCVCVCTGFASAGALLSGVLGSAAASSVAPGLIWTVVGRPPVSALRESLLRVLAKLPPVDGDDCRSSRRPRLCNAFFTLLSSCSLVNGLPM